MGLEVSFSGDFVSWSLKFFQLLVSNFETSLAVLQSPKFAILYP